MAVLAVRTYPDPVLALVAEAVREFGDDLERLIENMVETLSGSGIGIGLAAPQVGVSKRIFILDLSSVEGEETPLKVIINPKVTETEGEEEFEEGCLSLPGFSTMLKRPGRVVVEALDREGKPLSIEGEGLLARALQHEIDHLDGKLIIDRLNPIMRQFAKKRFLKSLANTG